MTPEVTLRTRYRTRSRTRALLAHAWWLLLPKPRWWWDDTLQFARTAVIVLALPLAAGAQNIPVWGQELKEDVAQHEERLRELESRGETLARIDERLKTIEGQLDVGSSSWQRDLGLSGGPSIVALILLYLLRRRNGH